MDINIPVENPELVMKIHDYMSSQSNADEKRLRNSLLKAKFLAPVSCKNWNSKNPGKQVIDHDVEFRLIVSAKYSCGFPDPQVLPIIVVERYLDYFTTIMEDRLWQVLAKPGFRWRNRSGLSMNAARAA